MNMEPRNSISTSAHPQIFRKAVRSFRSLQLLNGGVHWISAVVLVYAFINNGETTRALINPVAMRGEVKLGLVVGLIFLVRFICVKNTHSCGGRWVGSSVKMPRSKIRRITDWGIYLGVAASVVSGLLIAYLRPGVELIPEVRGFTTSSAALNVAIDAHAFISNALEWLCAFHAVYALWYWRIRRTQWGRTASVWLERGVSATSRVVASPLRGKTFRL